MATKVQNKDVLIGKEEFQKIIKGLFGNSPIKKFASPLDVKLNDIVYNEVGGKVDFYKVKKAGVINSIDDSYLTKINLTNSNSFDYETLKKKILNG